MSKPASLLAAIVLLSSAMALLAGCGSPAPTEQPSAQPANTDSPTAGPVATASGPQDATPVPALTPLPTAAAGLEFMSPQDSFGSSGKQEQVTAGDSRNSRKDSPGDAGSVAGDAYTWEDGDRTLTAYLQTDLVVEKGSGGLVRDIVPASDAGVSLVRGAVGQSESDTLPVFRSESGDLMTLPGGVLLVLDPEWSTTEVNAFFSSNGIKNDSVSELSYAANGFFIETEPGFPSLELANALASKDGVKVSSPNWGREAGPK